MKSEFAIDCKNIRLDSPYESTAMQPIGTDRDVPAFATRWSSVSGLPMSRKKGYTMARTKNPKTIEVAKQAAEADPVRPGGAFRQANDGRDVAGGLGPTDPEPVEQTIVELLLEALVNRQATSRRSNGPPERDPGPRVFEAELIRGRKFVLSRSPDSVWFRPNERVAVTVEEYEYLQDSHARQKFEDRHAEELVIRLVPVFRFYKDGKALPDREWPEERLPLRTPETW